MAGIDSQRDDPSRKIELLIEAPCAENYSNTLMRGKVKRPHVSETRTQAYPLSKYSIYIRACVAKRRVSARAVGESLTRVRAEAVGRGSNLSLASHGEIINYIYLCYNEIYFSVTKMTQAARSKSITLQLKTI